MKEPLPMRMSDTSQLPPALRDAFGRLGSETPSAETVLRVQRALEALPAATPAAAAMGTLGASKLLVVAALIVGAGTTAVVLQSRLGAPQTIPTTHVATTPSPPSPVSSANPASPQAPASIAASGASNAAPPLIREGSRHAARAQGRATDTAPPRAKARAAEGTRGPSADLSPQWAQSLLVPSTSRPAQRANGQQRADGQAAAILEPAPSAALPPAEPSGETVPAGASVPGQSLAAAQASEAEKLAQCKRLAVREPEAALQQLEALAREAPHGVFVQERELLEIRLHERLGHGARAAQLTQQFLERHPNSVYRRALSP